MSDTIPIHEEWACVRCTLFNPAGSVICVVCGETQPLPEQMISRPERHGRDRPREQHSGAWSRAMGFLGTVAGSAAGAILSSTRQGARSGAGDHAIWMAFGAAAGIEVVHLVRHVAARTEHLREDIQRRLSRPRRGLGRIRWQDPAVFRDYLRSEFAELPWMQRGTPQALRLLAANQQGRPPQRPVERMHLMQLLLELHRQAYERTGDPMSGLEAVMAARQSITSYNQISPEELRDYYHNFGCPSVAQGVPAEAMKSLPSTTVRVLKGLPSIDGKEASICSICLDDFARGQRVRELPKCRHVYHARCVDRWLCMHNDCPLCRMPAV
ncbi:hypothetical protein CVIRNUC_003883 [Coccomyxa viridis]|uniref:RING-type domain-containing protein n=1 Tax=Coccomyxa viridis TaxID=1274662 RepID=A0AAV1I087_9CHLO|nr:hypothetical protein CVIRNUC_003883 [Coccomyxa viridis]